MKNFILLLFQSIASFGKIILLSKFKNILRLEKPISKKSILILGNGPTLSISINKHMDSIKKSELLCVNNFAASQLFEILKPRYYIIAAHVFFQKEETLTEEYISMRNLYFGAIQTKTSWEFYLMVPFVAKKSDFFQSFLKSNQFIKPIYFNTAPVEGLSSLNIFFFKKGWGMPRPHNVLIPAIMNMIYLGFTEIKILGADHSWLKEINVNDKNEALVHQKHFYDENQSKPLKMQDYLVRPRRLHEIIHKFYLSFRGYWDIKEYAEKQKVKIINCSEESMIDAFDRGKLN